jgi:copper chaperone CopZ
MKARTALALAAGLLISPVAGAAERTETIKVSGWRSKGDAYKTESSLRGVKGVLNVTADFASGSMTVRYEDTQVDRKRLEKAVADAGYAVSR